MTFTQNEKNAIVSMIDDCLTYVGNEDFDPNKMTWGEAVSFSYVDIAALVDAGWDDREAEIVFDSLLSKKMISACEGFDSILIPYMIDVEQAAPIWEAAKNKGH